MLMNSTKTHSLTTHQDVLMRVFSYREQLQRFSNDKNKKCRDKYYCHQQPHKIGVYHLCVCNLSDCFSVLPLSLRSLLWHVLPCSSNNQPGSHKNRITLDCKGIRSYSSFFLTTKYSHEEPRCSVNSKVLDGYAIVLLLRSIQIVHLYSCILNPITLKFSLTLFSEKVPSP